MKKEKHPDYQEVLFIDSSTGAEFICGTTLKTKERRVAKTDGKEYPAFHISVSSKSHPFFVGGQHIDTEGRIQKFNQRYKRPQG
jgi:large subunit ribosomal protein L31